jgi:putative tryptophan/tyrosine transport system substrate-binding protein
MLKQILPNAQRVAVLRDVTNDPAGIGQWGALQSVAPSLGLELIPASVRDADEIEHGVAAFSQAPNGALIVTPTALAAVHREQIVALAARYRLPAVYSYRYFVTSGGLLSYGPDTIDPYRRAAVYVVRILKGEKPANLPVQNPTKYELAINLRTAKALGPLLAIADEVIQ